MYSNYISDINAICDEMMSISKDAADIMKNLDRSTVYSVNQKKEKLLCAVLDIIENDNKASKDRLKKISIFLDVDFGILVEAWETFHSLEYKDYHDVKSLNAMIYHHFKDYLEKKVLRKVILEHVL